MKIIKNIKEIELIGLSIALLLFAILGFKQTIEINELKETTTKLENKLNKVELDYQFLKYNKEQLNEVQYENR